MTGRVFPLNASEHAAADAFLPFYVNGTLRGAELERVEQHLAGCPACRREVDWLKDVFAACAAMEPLPAAPRSLAGPGADEHRPTRSHPWRTRARAVWQSTPPWTRMAMAAQLAGLVLLGSLLAFDAGTEPSYHTLGSAAPHKPAGEAIAVMFDPALSEAELRRMVTGAGARIVDGPTTTQAFVLEVPAGQSAAVIQHLRAHAGVRFAEPLGAAAGP